MRFWGPFPPWFVSYTQCDPDFCFVFVQQGIWVVMTWMFYSSKVAGQLFDNASLDERKHEMNIFFIFTVFKPQVLASLSGLIPELCKTVCTSKWRGADDSTYKT